MEREVGIVLIVGAGTVQLWVKINRLDNMPTGTYRKI